MKFISSVFALFLICLSYQSIPSFGSSAAIDEFLMSFESKSSSSPHPRRKSKPKTISEPTTWISKDALSLLMSEIDVKKGRVGNFATITAGTINTLPNEILDKDLRLLLEGKEVILLGRKTQLDKDSLKFAEDLRKQAEMIAKIDETNLSEGAQRLGRKSSSRRKKFSGKYGVYAETENGPREKIFLDIVLEIHFSK